MHTRRCPPPPVLLCSTIIPPPPLDGEFVTAVAARSFCTHFQASASRTPTIPWHPPVAPPEVSSKALHESNNQSLSCFISLVIHYMYPRAYKKALGPITSRRFFTAQVSFLHHYYTYTGICIIVQQTKTSCQDTKIL